MTPRVLPEGYARATVGGTYGPTVWENVLHFGVAPVDGATPLQVMQDIAAGAFLLYTSLDPANFSFQWTTSTVKVLWRDALGSLNRATVADAIPGTDSDAAEAAQVAYLVELTTDDIRKGGKGRIYISGVTQLALADSANLSADTLGSMNSGLLTWLETCQAGSAGANATVLNPAVMSWINAGAVEDPGVPYVVNTAHMSPQVATQRRRVDRLR